MSEDSQTNVAEKTENTDPAKTAATPQQRQSVEVSDANAVASYANFCRVTGTPEELIVDFGINSQPFGTPTEPIKITQRLIVNFYTAKRLLAALNMSIQRHEQAFGVLETDVRRRVQPGAGNGQSE